MRTGKIARLPAAIREEVGRRLEDGQGGEKILRWLNGLPEVREVLAARFGGRPLTKFNLSRWRQGGGHQDWREERRIQAVAEKLAETAREHAQADGADKLATGAAATMGIVLAEAAKKMFSENDNPLERVNKVALATRGLVALRWAVKRQERDREHELEVKLLQEKSRLEQARHELLVRKLKAALAPGRFKSPETTPDDGAECPTAAPASNPAAQPAEALFPSGKNAAKRDELRPVAPGCTPKTGGFLWPNQNSHALALTNGGDLCGHDRPLLSSDQSDGKSSL